MVEVHIQAVLEELRRSYKLEVSMDRPCFRLQRKCLRPMVIFGRIRNQANYRNEGRGGCLPFYSFSNRTLLYFSIIFKHSLKEFITILTKVFLFTNVFTKLMTT